MKNTIFVFAGVLVAAFSTMPIPASAASSRCEYTGSPAPIKGRLLDDVRVMTMNVYGQNDDSEQKCQARLRTIGSRIANQAPLFDIVGLQEVHPDYVGYSCDGRQLAYGIRENGEYTGNKGRWGHPDTTKRFHHDGGTSLFSTVEFDWSPYEDHVHEFDQLGWRTAHGFIYARIQLTPGIAIDVYVAHLHSKGGGWFSESCDQECRYEELQQLAEVIHERSSNSGAPVLVMGDFNIGGPNPTAVTCGGNPGYGDIMSLLRNPRDLWLEANPDLIGSTGPKGNRIDFMFVLTDSYFTNSPYELVISNPTDVKLMDWGMPGYARYSPRIVNGSPVPIPPGCSALVVPNAACRAAGFRWIDGPFRLSDHHGIEAKLEIRRKLSVAAVLAAIN